MGQRWDDTGGKIAHVRGEKPARNVSLSTSNLTRTDVESNPVFRSERLATKHLSHGTVWLCADGSYRVAQKRIL